MTARSFTHAATAPIDLVDGALLIRSMHRSRKGVLLPQTYKAMCRQCGAIVQHRLDRGEALPCGNGTPSPRRLPAPLLSNHAGSNNRRPPITSRNGSRARNGAT